MFKFTKKTIDKNCDLGFRPFDLIETPQIKYNTLNLTNTISVNGVKYVKLPSILSSFDMESIVKEINISYECVNKHLNVFRYGDFIVLHGIIECNICKNINNLVFDLKTHTFQSVPFTHEVLKNSELKPNSTPIFVFMVIYINEKWNMVSYNSEISQLITFNNNKMVHIFNSSFGCHDINILPKNSVHIFAKSILSIVENDDKKFSYIISYEKMNKKTYKLKKLQTLFPECFNIKIKLARFNKKYFDITIISYIDDFDIITLLLKYGNIPETYNNLTVTSKQAFMKLLNTKLIDFNISSSTGNIYYNTFNETESLSSSGYANIN
jgi:hypothetical protein